MSDIAIRVENLGKEYHIGSAPAGYRTFRETVTDAVALPFRKLGGLARGHASAASELSESFWALRDVSFEVKRGEVLGVIGRNGAGKSTLLKILSRITEPTTGRVELHGRVGSLLEVGTGFHPELTGRENIFLNGAILGMSRDNIQRRFDEIVAFAEIDRFLDTPVKRYSSGMYMRLAFSVAAHLEPEVLVVDEVLAVGDAEFQKKCLGKMGEVAGEGRTVIFVSHNMSAIRQLCRTALVLNKGIIDYHGVVGEAVEQYMGSSSSQENDYEDLIPKTHPYVRAIRIRQMGSIRDIYDMDKPIEIEVELDSIDEKEVAVGLEIQSNQGVYIHHTSDEMIWMNNEPVYDNLRICTLPAYALSHGKHQVSIGLGKRNYELYQMLEHIVHFSVRFTGPMSDRTAAESWKGLCGPGLLRWTTRRI